MSTTLLIIWTALLGADRIDLLGGTGPVLLLPFQLLTALVVLVEWRRRVRTNSLPRITPAAAQFGALVFGLLALIALSILRSADVAVSMGRALLLTATAVGVPLAVWGASDRVDLLPILARGARLGLAIAAVFGVLQVMNLIGAVPDTLLLGPISVSFEASTYGILPRLAGAASDMNRGGLIALIHTALIALALPPIRARRAWIALGAVLVVGSLSRSVLLAAVPVLFLTPRVASGRTAVRAALAAVLAVVAMGSAMLLDPAVRESVGRATAPLAQRFSPQEGSSQAHAFLFTRAVDVATTDVPGTLLGIGFGTSFRVLADFFAGNKYGNFHSTWFTLWVESGVIAMFVALALLALAIPRAGPMVGVIVGLVFYNAFYNGISEPLLWVALALVWLTPRPLVGSPAPATATAFNAEDAERKREDAEGDLGTALPEPA